MKRALQQLLLLSLAFGQVSAKPPADGPDFTTEVRPILSQHCFKCHGPDEKSRKGKLRLDSAEESRKPAKSGDRAVVPGKVEESELVQRIFSTDEEEVMPPPSAKKDLSAAEKLILKRWVAAGAEYQPHWAFQKPHQQQPPFQADVRHPIDAFVRARLQKEGLPPAAPADRLTLVRRVFLDLVGVPPTPEQVNQFTGDSSADAYQKLVDRLLASPQYGERWARKWLDLARYADTNGYEKDRPRTIWPYRDWVINALNADMPFDQFTVEQIAGDMLPNPTPAQLVATGFHRNTMLNEEGGIDPLEFRFHAVTDRVATTGKTWLGLTVGCAQCHTHKFDPITHREYYQIMAFLNNADEPDYRIPPAGELNRKAQVEAKIARLSATLPERFPRESWTAADSATLATASGQPTKAQEDGSFLQTGPDTDTYTVNLTTKLESLESLRLEALPDPKLPKNGPGRAASGNFVLSEITITAAPLSGTAESLAAEKPQPVKIARAEADFSQQNYAVALAFDGNPKTGWGVADAKGKAGVARTATFYFEKPLHFEGGIRLTVTLAQNHGNGHNLGRFRFRLPEKPSSEVQSRQLAEQKFSAWLDETAKTTNHWTVLRPVEAKSNLPLLTVLEDNSVLASGDQTKADVYTLKLRPPTGPITALRLEVLPDESLPANGPGRVYYEGTNGDFNLSDFKLQSGGRPVKIASAKASTNDKDAAHAIDDNQQSGWSVKDVTGRANAIVFTLAEPLTVSGELVLEMHFEKYHAAALGRFRLWMTADNAAEGTRYIPPQIESLLLLPHNTLAGTQRTQLWDYFLATAPELKEPNAEIEKLRATLEDGQLTLVMHERPADNPRPTFIHHRGEYLQTTDPVTPGVLSVLNPLPPGVKADRLAFARWLVSADNPLTARVVVNRQWAAFFGRGLVKSVDDFGYQGSAPSHPELLDWLAVEFIKEGWSLKRLHRLIVTSATYQQNSALTEELLFKDPQNILLARGPRVRLEAEQIRDSLLSASGLLTNKIGGPSVYPPQPAGANEAAFRNREWPTSTGPERFRRALYTFAKRTAPYAMFNTFDGPVGDVCIAQRDVSNSALQALTMLNDTVVMEAAQALGTTIAALAQPDQARLQNLFERCLSRPPSAAEIDTLLGFLQTQRTRAAAKELDVQRLAGPGKGDELERAAWTAVARVILNLDELLTKS